VAASVDGLNDLFADRPGWLWFVTVVTGIATIGGFLLILERGNDPTVVPEGPPGTQSYKVTNRRHVPGAVDYRPFPPVGGNHAPIWLDCGIYDREVRAESAVHSMEHGAVWVTYEPSLPEEQLRHLRNRVRSNLKNVDQGYVILSPIEDLPAPIITSAWGKQLRLDDANDPRLQAFFTSFKGGPQAQEPGNPCLGGLGDNWLRY